MDGIQPVGAMIQPQQPNQGLNAYSTLLGIQQQQLGIQQQQQGLQGQAAQVSQEQQRNAEMQKAHQVAIDASQGKYNAPDGSLDRVRMSRDISAIGPYAQGMAGSLLSQANEVVQNKAAIQNLTAARKQEIGSTLQSLAQDPNLDQSKFIDAVERLRSQHPNDPEFSRLLTSTTAMAVSPGDSPDQMRTKLGQLWSSVSGQPVTKPYAVGVGPGIISGGENVLSGQRTPQSFQKVGLGPAQEPGYLEEAGAREAKGRTLGGGPPTMDVQRAGEVAGKAQTASATVQLSKQVDALAEGINSGEVAKLFAKGANYMGFSSVAQMRTQLQKDLGQLRGAVASRAGSDARASEILEGYPTDTTPTNTIHAAMDYIRGSARQDLARASQLQQFQKQKGPENLAGFQAADTGLVSRTNPLMHEYMALSPQEKGAFYRRNFKTPQEAQKFKDSVKAAGGGQSGP